MGRRQRIRQHLTNRKLLAMEQHLMDRKILRDKAAAVGGVGAAVGATNARGKAAGPYIEVKKHIGDPRPPIQHNHLARTGLGRGRRGSECETGCEAGVAKRKTRIAFHSTPP